jgi:hypothetical protein
MPISEKQLAANRTTGAKSRRPVTPGTKHNSSRNAIRDGFLATSVVLRGESRERFLELHASLITEIAPESPKNFNLVETMGVCLWRQLRLWTVETGYPHIHENLRRQEFSFDRQYHRPANNLRLLKENQGNEKKRLRTHQVDENKGSAQ